MIRNQKGFTLIELLVVVLIIGILAAMAMPQYFKAVERSRMTEAVTLLGNIAQAQQRKYLQINHYVSNFKGLDVSPKGATGSFYYTKGDPVSAGGNGFRIDLSAAQNYQGGKATATRHSSAGNLQYEYELERYYANTGTKCTGTNANGEALCADFCGIDDYTAPCCSDGSTTAGAGTNCNTPSANDQ